MILGLYGAGGLGRGLYDMIIHNSRDKQWDHIIFIDDFDEEGVFYGVERMQFRTVLERFQSNDIEFLIAVGEPQNRKLLADRIRSYGYKLATYIDNTSIVSSTAWIAEGVIVCSNSVIDSSVKIESNVLIEHLCVIGHNSVIEENSVVSSHSVMGGYCCIGNTTFLGLSTVLKDGIKLGSGVIAAMGSVIFRDVEDNMTVVGNPARITKGSNSRRVWD